ncbi:hypothetical protein M1N88_01975 [Dehalococcoidia bacterium]|nr:hypothetical protein [Dehalococcoidia bacterium]
MTIDLGLLIGLISIGLGLFLGLFFGLAGFRKGVISELSSIKEAVIAIRTTVDKTWDLILLRFGESGGTVTRELENLGKVKITAEPAGNQTIYLIEIERPVLKEGLFLKKAKEPEFVKQETKFLGKEGEITILSPHRIRYHLPSTDPKACTGFVTFLLKWVNSTYVESLKDIKEFEEPILT